MIAVGYAVDDAGLQDGLYCLAVPVPGPGGAVIAALSASFRSNRPVDIDLLEPLQNYARRIGRRMGARGAKG